MWVVLLQSSFEFNIRKGANSQQFWHYSCLCPCQQNSLVLLWPFLCCVSANMPLQGTREILCLHERFCFTFALACLYGILPSLCSGRKEFHSPFPFLIVVSSEKHFAMLYRRMLHKFKCYCIVSVYCLSCISSQVIFSLGTRQLHENLVLTVQCYFLLQAK